MSERVVRVETQSGVAVVTIDRARELNALNAAVVRELSEVFARFAGDAAVRAVVLTGAGEKAFVAGADIKELAELSPAEARATAGRGQALTLLIEGLPQPVIAAVNGFALGGGFELAIACDFIIADEKARWGLPEVTLGVVPGYGGTQRLVRLAGRAVARRVALSGEMFTARQGLEWGVFTEVTAPGDAVARAKAVAQTIATRAPRAVALAKEAIHRGADHTLAAGLELEASAFERAFETADKTEGLNAFLAKRAPDFRGV